MRKGKIPMKKVQKAFADAIKRRDKICRVRDYEPCDGGLECSHFFTQGGNPSLMFYPPNAYAQCAKHHRNHHSKNEPFYLRWISTYHSDDLVEMQRLRSGFIKYTDELKAEIIRLCNEDRLDALKELIKGKLEGENGF